jgi:hypothetical protein
MARQRRDRRHHARTSAPVREACRRPRTATSRAQQQVIPLSARDQKPAAPPAPPPSTPPPAEDAPALSDDEVAALTTFHLQREMTHARAA